MRRCIITILLATSSSALLASPPEYATFLAGERLTYNTGTDPKAKSVEISFAYPSTWKGLPGNRPNVLYQVTSKEGRGMESCNLLVNFPKDEDGSYVEPHEAPARFTVENIDWFKVPGAEFLAGEPTTIDSLPAFWILSRHEVDRAGIKIKMYSLIFSTYYERKLIGFTCMVGADASLEWEAVQNQMREFVPLFQQMAGSIIVHTRWKDMGSTPSLSSLALGL